MKARDIVGKTIREGARTMKKKAARPGWDKWYREAREDMEFRYGQRGIPTDVYKTHHALGYTPQQAVKAIAGARRFQ